MNATPNHVKMEEHVPIWLEVTDAHAQKDSRGKTAQFSQVRKAVANTSPLQGCDLPLQ